MRYVSLFSGIEAASCAWEPLDWEPMAFAEIEPFPCKVLATRFPSVPNLGDVSNVDWSPYHGADVVVGGSPCQSFSLAGSRKGLDDARGRLMLEYIRAVRDIGPRWCVWENVPGVLSQDKGRAFATLIRELSQLGYSLAWRVLDAQFFRVAQRRRRVFLIGNHSVGRAAAVLFDGGCLPGSAGTSRKKREAISRDVGRSPKRECPITGFDGGVRTHASICDNVSPTLLADHHPVVSYCVRQREGHGPGGHGPLVSEELSLTLATVKDMMLFTEIDQGNGPQWRVRYFTPTECERLQGFPDGWTDIPGASDTARYKALGNSMAVPVMRWLGERIQEVDHLPISDPKSA